MFTPLTIQHGLKTSFDSQYVKRLQTLVKTPWEYFYHIFSSLWGEIFWKTSPRLKFGIIGLFVKHGLQITSILFRTVRICRSLFKSSYLKNKKKFLRFLCPLWNLHQILNIFKKKEDRHSLCISKINDRLRLYHATHYLVPSQNILPQSTC